MISKVLPQSRPLPILDGDRIGVIASVLCAIHCVLTPILLILLPNVAEVWAHPASHWLMALLVIPLAGLMMTKGYQKNRRKWILVCGGLGILFVIVGALAPYFDQKTVPAVAPVAEETSTCTDSCCPSIQTDETGQKKVTVPPASILTTLGGLFLIVTHVGNLCRCPECKR